ncbi:MAG: SOS response-associated peptidase [Propioniciclava sp.]
MCGRFAASALTDDLVEAFGVDVVVDEPQPSFNLAPTDPVPAVLERAEQAEGSPVRKLLTPRWGLVPSWSTDARQGARMINARVETVVEKPAFRKAVVARRCLIPADGFYEWSSVPAARGGKPVKQPWFIRPAGGGMLVMAGLYEFWKDRSDPDASWLTTCTIITTEATDALGALHDRMPMVVRPADWAAWLDPTKVDPQAVIGLLDVDHGTQLETYPVSRAVNSVRNDGEALLKPLG